MGAQGSQQEDCGLKERQCVLGSQIQLLNIQHEFLIKNKFSVAIRNCLEQVSGLSLDEPFVFRRFMCTRNTHI